MVEEQQTDLGEQWWRAQDIGHKQVRGPCSVQALTRNERWCLAQSPDKRATRSLTRSCAAASRNPALRRQLLRCNRQLPARSRRTAGKGGAVHGNLEQSEFPSIESCLSCGMRLLTVETVYESFERSSHKLLGEGAFAT